MGAGSTPALAILPANIEIIIGVRLSMFCVISFTWSIVKTAVIFNFTPKDDNDFIIGAVEIPFVLVIGIFTYTLLPHFAIFFACSSISSNLSEKTSKEIGLSEIVSNTSFANFS